MCNIYKQKKLKLGSAPMKKNHHDGRRRIDDSDPYGIIYKLDDEAQTSIRSIIDNQGKNTSVSRC